MNMSDFAEIVKIGDLLDKLLNQTDKRKNPQFSDSHKRPFVREYKPGKTFANQPDIDSQCRDSIVETLAVSFTEFNTLVRATEMTEETMSQIIRGRMEQFKAMPGLLYVAGFTNNDPNGLFEALVPDISAAVLGHSATVPPVPGINFEEYYIIEEALERIDLAAGGMEPDDKCFVCSLISAKHDVTNGGDRIKLLLLLEKALADGARRLGFTMMRTINTSVATQVLFLPVCPIKQ